LDDPFAALLDAIVRGLVISDAQKDVDLNASAEESASTLEAEKQRAVSEAANRKRSLSAPFRQGLIVAFEAQGTDHQEIRLDDRDPVQNAIADALISYLVSFDLAESRSEETEPGHYDYFISVKWDPLYEFANRAGVDLPAALARAATIPGG
jgi:hypothetical protein